MPLPRIAIIHREDIKWSIADVTEGLRYGLTANGATVSDDWRHADWTIVVNPMFQTPERIAEMRRYVPVAVLCTETPYDLDRELACVAIADAGWTHERVSVPDFQRVNPQFGYLPHAWHPERHFVAAPDPSVPVHDVVFVGSGFSERAAWLNRIDWTGIDLGLYGLWDSIGLDEHIEQRYVKADVTDNVYAAALYRNAKIGLNLYRTRPGIHQGGPRTDVIAESMNPRAYELAACGVFALSTGREEEYEKFGASVTLIDMDDPKRSGVIIREWLQRPILRRERIDHAYARVAHDSWPTRARQVLADLKTWSQVAA